MRDIIKTLLKTGTLCGMLMTMSPFTALASIGPGFTAGTYAATITAESVDISKDLDSQEVLLTAEAGSTYEVLEEMENGWVNVRVNDTEGYLPVSENVQVEEVDEEEMAQIQEEAVESSESYRRQNLVDFALQFVGGRYMYGGTDPHVGVDCSGFTRYVLQNGAGVPMSRSSRGQAAQGVQVSADHMQPGDLLFYGGSVSSIDHVAMYIGNGQVVHASTERTGIKISPWNYRNPVKITNVLG